MPNVGVTNNQNLLHYNNVMSWKLESWSKYVCKAVILPSHWSYIEHKQAIGAKVAGTEALFR